MADAERNERREAAEKFRMVIGTLLDKDEGYAYMKVFFKHFFNFSQKILFSAKADKAKGINSISYCLYS